MKLHCPDCGATVPADDVNLESGMAKCRACDGVFGFRSAEETQQRTVAGAKPRTVPIVARPDRMRVDDWGATCRIHWRWFTAGYLFLLVFAIAWDSFLIFWYSMAFSTDVLWIMVVFPIAHVAAGVAITYTVLTGLLNSTVVEVGSGMLSIRHRPLPWRGNRTLAAIDIKQLYCDESSYRQNNQRSFRLCVIMKSGRKITLLSSTDADDVRFLEQELERRLNIAPQSVAGEIA